MKRLLSLAALLMLGAGALAAQPAAPGVLAEQLRAGTGTRDPAGLSKRHVRLTNLITRTSDQLDEVGTFTEFFGILMDAFAMEALLFADPNYLAALYEAEPGKEPDPELVRVSDLFHEWLATTSARVLERNETRPGQIPWPDHAVVQRFLELASRPPPTRGATLARLGALRFLDRLGYISLVYRRRLATDLPPGVLQAETLPEGIDWNVTECAKRLFEQGKGRRPPANFDQAARELELADPELAKPGHVPMPGEDPMLTEAYLLDLALVAQGEAEPRSPEVEKLLTDWPKLFEEELRKAESRLETALQQHSVRRVEYGSAALPPWIPVAALAMVAGILLALRRRQQVLSDSLLASSETVIDDSAAVKTQPATTEAGPAAPSRLHVAAGEELPDWLEGALRQPLGDRYREVRVLGSGGMGTVVAARDERLGRNVAIKIPPPHLASEAEYRQRFLREARALATLSHSNIAIVHDVPDVASGGVPLMIMEYLEGRDLFSIVNEDGPQPIDRVADWISQAAAALSHAHGSGVLHRDVKPANMMLAGDTLKVLDFGLAMIEGSAGLTRSGVVMGSMPYMPPEQLQGETVDASADQYSLAVSAFQLLTGELPFDLADPERRNRRKLADYRAELPEELDAVFEKALAGQPEQRYPDIAAFGEAFAAAAG